MINDLYRSILIISTDLAGPVEAPKVCYKCKKVGHLSKDCKEHPNDSSHGHANGGVGDNSRASLDETTEMDRVAMEDEDIHEIGEEKKKIKWRGLPYWESTAQ